MDRHARNQAAALLDAFVRHELTNDQLEASWPESTDPALRAISRAVWLTYDDLKEQRGPSGGHQFIERCSGFLRTNEPYVWPSAPLWRELLVSTLSLVTLGLVRLSDGGPSLEEPWPFKPD